MTVIAAAALLWHNLPTPDDVYGSFDVKVDMGQTATGRAVQARVDGVRMAPRIRQDRDSAPVVDAVGTWVAIEGAAMTTRTSETVSSELIVGPNTYVLTDRVGFQPLAGALSPGLLVSGAWVFDVPADLVKPDGPEMTLHVWVGDRRQDSRLVIRMRPDDLRVSRADLIRLRPSVEIGT